MRPISREQTLFVASMLVSAFSLMVMAPACQGAEVPPVAQETAAVPETSWGKEVNGLQVRIRECPAGERKEGKVIMIFEVRNTSEKPVEFCWWQSPLEKRCTAGRFKVTGPDGGEVAYEGIMVKRSPPSRENGDFVTLRPGWTLAATFDLKEAYPSMKAGSTYSITYEGTVMGPLPDSNTVSIALK